jgi:hypothetical protein
VEKWRQMMKVVRGTGEWEIDQQQQARPFRRETSIGVLWQMEQRLSTNQSVQDMKMARLG